MPTPTGAMPAHALINLPMIHTETDLDREIRRVLIHEDVQENWKLVVDGAGKLTLEHEGQEPQPFALIGLQYFAKLGTLAKVNALVQAIIKRQGWIQR